LQPLLPVEEQGLRLPQEQSERRPPQERAEQDWLVRQAGQ
jgi:hypothetical protein